MTPIMRSCRWRNRRPARRACVYDVVGPVCETSDLFAAGRALPELKDGDLVAILTAGAYGAVMASAYNARPPAPEVLVAGERMGHCTLPADP